MTDKWAALRASPGGDVMPLLELLKHCRLFVVQDMKMRDIEHSNVLDNIDYYLSFEGPL